MKVVLFYSNMCGHCHAMRPEWDKFVSKHGSNVVDIEQEQLMGHPIQDQIEGFPTIVKMQNGQIVRSFSGNRTADTFTNFLKEYPSVEEEVPKKRKATSSKKRKAPPTKKRKGPPSKKRKVAKKSVKKRKPSSKK